MPHPVDTAHLLAEAQTLPHAKAGGITHIATIECLLAQAAGENMSRTEVQEWAEKAGIENLKGRLATGDFLLTQANTLLSILLVGIGGGLAYAVRLAEGASASVYSWGMAGATVWLCVVAAVLTAKCIVTRDTPVLYNEPKNLFNPEHEHTLMEMRGFELKNIQARIKDVGTRNADVAKWLDRCRYAAIATPLAFIAAVCAAVYR
ncbi:MAG: hypothetical protein PGN26_14490 [Xylophilus ampelinus]